MKQELQRHKLAYTILIVGLIVITLAFLGAWPNRWLQRGVILFMVVFYTLWGSLTHLHSQQITKRVISEYASMSLLAGVLLLLVTIS